MYNFGIGMKETHPFSVNVLFLWELPKWIAVTQLTQIKGAQKAKLKEKIYYLYLFVVKISIFATESKGEILGSEGNRAYIEVCEFWKNW